MAYHTVRVPLSFRSNLFRKFVEAAEGWRAVALARLGGSEGWRRKAKVGEIWGSPWAPFPFWEGGGVVVVFVFLPASVSEITSAVITLKPAGQEPHGVHQVSVMSIQAVRINTPFACLSHLGAYSRSKAFKRKGFFASLLFCYALSLFRLSLSLSFIHKESRDSRLYEDASVTFCPRWNDPKQQESLLTSGTANVICLDCDWTRVGPLSPDQPSSQI